MDYSLTSILTAFSDEEYKKSKINFSLYAVLLASSLDQEFVLDYLKYFHELDFLTGDKILIMGPQLVSPDEIIKKGFTQTNIRQHQLSAISDVVNHKKDFNFSDTEVYDSAPAHKFLSFMQNQTRESYAVARFFGIRTDLMPLIVFFDTLTNPSDFVIREVKESSGKSFVKKFKSFIDDLYEKFNWHLIEEIPKLKNELIRLTGYSATQQPELRNEYKEYDAARDLLLTFNIASSFYEKLKSLRIVYDKVISDENLKFPREDIGKTLSDLEEGNITNDAFLHFSNHLKRWKTRMPDYYKNVISSFHYPSSIVKDNKLTISENEALEGNKVQTDIVHRLEHAYYEKISRLKLEIKNRIQKAESAQKIKSSILQFTQDWFKNESYKKTNSNYLNLRNLQAISSNAVPKVFISYSHDSKEHKAGVLELAQHLRGDGIDCWIDQFEEQGPTKGFPRWMIQQISQADFVLLVCTPNYKNRFDNFNNSDTGLGVMFEGHIILQELYESQLANKKFIPILLAGNTPKNIPLILRGNIWYEMPGSYMDLLNRLFNKGTISPRKLGDSYSND